MQRPMTISRLARQAGVPSSTIRYYERIGLVEPEQRSQGNYRLYSDDSLRRVKFIRAAQTIGFTLDDVKALLADERGGSPTCGSVQTLIEDRLADVEQRLKDLRYVRRVLKKSLSKCKQQESNACCHVVESLRN